MALPYASHYLQFVASFNRGQYRACLEPLEELWFVERDDFHKALIRLVVALNQIELGLQSGPEFLLRTALALLVPYGAAHGGLDLGALRGFIAAEHAALAEAAPRPAPYMIRLDPPPDAAA